jgi:hypothetical protein
MKRLFVVFGVIASMILITLAIHSVAQAMCHTKAYCYAEDDTGGQPLAIDGPYDPCDSWILYEWEFYRTSQTGQRSAIRFTVMEGTTYKWYSQHSSDDYEEGHYDGSGSAYVGSSSNHTLQIRRASPGLTSGNFEDMAVGVNYVADDPTK